MISQHSVIVSEIDASSLVRSQHLLREEFSELDDLMQSIRVHGLLNPLIFNFQIFDSIWLLTEGGGQNRSLPL
jgi:ParB-like chromosome segregation protein Spo0J